MPIISTTMLQKSMHKYMFMQVVEARSMSSNYPCRLRSMEPEILRRPSHRAAYIKLLRYGADKAAQYSLYEFEDLKEQLSMLNHHSDDISTWIIGTFFVLIEAGIIYGILRQLHVL